MMDSSKWWRRFSPDRGSTRSGRKNILPDPLAIRSGVFPGQSIRQEHRTKSLSQILLVRLPHLLKVLYQERFGDGGKHRDAIFLPFAVADRYLMTVKIQILDPQTQRLQQSQSSSI
jgi:hypothetical protein